MKLTKIGWEWARFHIYRNKASNTFICNFSPAALGFEVYWCSSSVIVYLELCLGTLMVRLAK